MHTTNEMPLRALSNGGITFDKNLADNARFFGGALTDIKLKSCCTAFLYIVPGTLAICL